jgi:hypothetical protein
MHKDGYLRYSQSTFVVIQSNSWKMFQKSPVPLKKIKKNRNN